MQTSAASSSSSSSLFPSNSQSSHSDNESGQMLITEFGHAIGQLPAQISNISTIISCPICAEPSNGSFFGVPSCRACGAFFRRSVLYKRKYSCRKANNCAITNREGMRNSCRACRLKRCFEAGMDFSQKNSQNTAQVEKIPKKLSPQSIASSSETPAEFNNMSQNFPNAFKFLHYFRNIENGQRALVSVLEGTRKIILDHEQLHLVRHDEHIKIKGGSTLLLLEHIREQFPKFNDQSPEAKIGIVKSYCLLAGILRIGFSTLKFFPWQNVPIKNLVLNGCCFISTDEMDYFFSSHGSDNEERKKYGLACVEKFGVIVSRLKALNVSEIELSALIGIQLWNCIERFVPLSVEQKTHRNAFFVELHAMAAHNRSSSSMAEIGIRFGLLMNFLLDTSHVASELVETITLADLFAPSVHSFCNSDAVLGALLNHQ